MQPNHRVLADLLDSVSTGSRTFGIWTPPRIANTATIAPVYERDRARVAPEDGRPPPKA
jgi:hypothetical protein